MKATVLLLLFFLNKQGTTFLFEIITLSFAGKTCALERKIRLSR